MVTQRPKIICPKCNVEMNHHADKIDYTLAVKEPAATGKSPGGILVEFHSCPECGDCATRKAEQ